MPRNRWCNKCLSDCIRPACWRLNLALRRQMCVKSFSLDVVASPWTSMPRPRRLRGLSAPSREVATIPPRTQLIIILLYLRLSSVHLSRSAKVRYCVTRSVVHQNASKSPLGWQILFPIVQPLLAVSLDHNQSILFWYAFNHKPTSCPIQQCIASCSATSQSTKSFRFQTPFLSILRLVFNKWAEGELKNSDSVDIRHIYNQYRPFDCGLNFDIVDTNPDLSN